MWSALASVYETLNAYQDALKCYHRVLTVNQTELQQDEDHEAFGEEDVAALLRMGKLQQKVGHMSKAAECFRMVLDLRTNTEFNQDLADAVLSLGAYYKERRLTTEAERYLNMLADAGGPGQEEAKALLREVRSFNDDLFC
jgi:tetratricopeptide (TPR) repeat protein